MKGHTFHPEADEEYAEAAARYADIGPELGGRFYDKIERLTRLPPGAGPKAAQCETVDLCQARRDTGDNSVSALAHWLRRACNCS